MLLELEDQHGRPLIIAARRIVSISPRILHDHLPKPGYIAPKHDPFGDRYYDPPSDKPYVYVLTDYPHRAYIVKGTLQEVRKLWEGALRDA